MFCSITALKVSALVFMVLAAGNAAAAGPVQINDMQGNRVTLAQPAKRSVTLPMPASAIYAAVNGGVDGLAGMHPSAHDGLPTMLFPQLYPAINDVRHDINRGGFAPNVESLLQIKPDLVWQWGHMGDELIQPLKAAGIPTAALMLGKEAETRQCIKLIAQSLGKPERGEQLVAWREQMERKVRAQVAKVPANQRLKIMYMSRYKTGLAAAGQSSFFQYDSEIGGAVNVNTLKVAAPTINIEQLLMWNPDVIVLTNFERGLTPETLYKNPLFADISAVKARRVYKAPAGGYYWDVTSQDSPMYWVWIAKLLYPQQVTLDLRAEMHAGFKLLYGKDVTDAQIDQVLHWGTNHQSAHYAQAFAAPQTVGVR